MSISERAKCFGILGVLQSCFVYVAFGIHWRGRHAENLWAFRRESLDIRLTHNTVQLFKVSHERFSKECPGLTERKGVLSSYDGLHRRSGG